MCSRPLYGELSGVELLSSEGQLCRECRRGGALFLGRSDSSGHDSTHSTYSVQTALFVQLLVPSSNSISLSEEALAAVKSLSASTPHLCISASHPGLAEGGTPSRAFRSHGCSEITLIHVFTVLNTFRAASAAAGRASGWVREGVAAPEGCVGHSGSQTNQLRIFLAKGKGGGLILMLTFI